jgi:tryptophanyl-tRNA synthetase
MSDKKRILTGTRPTGPLHLGHYAGALENWVKLQHEYDCSFLIADYQVSDYADDLPRVRNAVWEVALDWLAVGLDPESGSFVIESMVPEHAELMTWLAWFLPVGMLERNPTLKAEMEAIENPEDAKTKGKSVPVAFYIYPVMQVANILMARAHLVPVGEDQLPHIELTRETARRFNREFKPIFPEPQALLGRVPRLVGTDGNAKMSKSRGNTIDLKDSAETVAKKVRRMYGGPPRGAKEPGKVAENPVLLYLEAFDQDVAQVRDLKERYERTGVSNTELKDRLTTVLNELLDPMRERRAKYESNMSLVRDALEQGTQRGRAIAQETMEMVRDALRLNYLRSADVPPRVRLTP